MQSADAAISSKILWLLGLVTVVGAFMRLYGLEIQSLWNDELSSWARSNYDSLTTVFDAGIKDDRHPPGYRIVLWLSINILGDSPTLLRLPSALAGILCVPGIFWVGYRLFDERVGLLAACFMAFSWAPVYFSQEATVYSILLGAITLSGGLAVALWQRRKASPLTLAMSFSVSALCACYLHYYGCLIVGLQLACLWAAAIAHDRRLIPNLLGVSVFLAAGYSLWIPHLMFQLSIPRGGGFPEISRQFILQIAEFLGGQSLTLAGVLFCCCAGAIVVTLMTGKKHGPMLVCMVLSIAPILILSILSMVYKPILAPRHLIIVLPAFYLLAAVGLNAISWPTLDPKLTAAVTAIGLALVLTFHLKYYQTVTKQQFREAAEWVDAYRSKHPNALVVGYLWSASYLNYYLAQMDSPQRLQFAGFGNEKQLPKLRKIVADRQPSHLIYATAHRRPRNNFVVGLEEIGDLQETHLLTGATVRLYELATND